MSSGKPRDGKLFTRIVREKSAIKKMFIEVSCIDNWIDSVMKRERKRFQKLYYLYRKIARSRHYDMTETAFWGTKIT